MLFKDFKAQAESLRFKMRHLNQELFEYGKQFDGLGHSETVTYTSEVNSLGQSKKTDST